MNPTKTITLELDAPAYGETWASWINRNGINIETDKIFCDSDEIDFMVQREVEKTYDELYAEARSYTIIEGMSAFQQKYGLYFDLERARIKDLPKKLATTLFCAEHQILWTLRTADFMTEIEFVDFHLGHARFHNPAKNHAEAIDYNLENLRKFWGSSQWMQHSLTKALWSFERYLAIMAELDTWEKRKIELENHHE